MFREIIIFGLVFLVHAQELQEGSPCMRDGVRGVCRKSKVCPSVALHIQDSGVICNNKGDDPVVCCTDCHIDDVSNAAVTLDGLVWKSGGTRKSYDKCVEYASTLPYGCMKSGTRLAVSKVYDAAGSCHRLQVTVNEGHSTTTATVKQRVEYPYLVLLGFTTASAPMETARQQWYCHGFIISERFILTTGHCSRPINNKIPKYVATSVEDRTSGLNLTGVDSTWQIYDVKRIIEHPDFKRPALYNDISLVETKTDIQFGPTVLPICLCDHPWKTDTAWMDILALNRTIESKKVSLGKLSKEECSKQFPATHRLWAGINYTSMVCFADADEHKQSCIFGPTVLPICLYDHPWETDTAWIDILALTRTIESKKVSLGKLSKEECSKQFPATHRLWAGINYTSMVCFADADEHKQSCIGSSGRPLYITGDLKCMKYVTALTSFGRSCGDSSLSSVYTRIDAFLPWIEKEVWPEPLPAQNLINPDIIYFND